MEKDGQTSKNMTEEQKNQSENVSGKKPVDKDVEENKTTAALSYAWILCLIPLLTKKDSKFAQFHAKQGLILLIASLLTWFPFFGQILGLAILVVSVIGIIKALNGEWWKIPYLYDISKNIKI